MRRHLLWLSLTAALVTTADGATPVRASRSRASSDASDAQIVERLRRAIQADLADSFPGARIQIRLLDRRVRTVIDVAAPALEDAAVADVLETLHGLVVSNVTLHAPGNALADDSAFTVRSGGRAWSRRAADFRLERARGPASSGTPAAPDRAVPGTAVAAEATDALRLPDPSTPEERPVPVARPRKARTDKGKVIDEGRREADALRGEREALARLARAKQPPERPWEAMKVEEEPAPEIEPETPPLVTADLIDLPTARVAPRHRVLLNARTAFRELDRRVYGNLVTASGRYQEFDFRIGLTGRLEAQVRPFFYDLDLTPVTAGTFSSLSSDHGAASFGLRYRLPYHERLFSIAAGFNASLIKDGDRQFLLPDDFRRLRGAYLALSHPGGDVSSWHAAVGWSPMDVPAGSPDNSVLSFGAGTDWRITDRIRGLGELIYEHFDVATVGRFGVARDRDFVVLNAGVRSAFRFATVDLFFRRLATEDVGEFGLVLRTEL